MEYGCGHEESEVIINSKLITYAEYLTWLETVGYRGDKSMCLACYERKKEIKHEM